MQNDGYVRLGTARLFRAPVEVHWSVLVVTTLLLVFQQDALVGAALVRLRRLEKKGKGAPRAVDYLKKRGLTGQIAKTFGLGYAPEGWRTLASAFPRYDDPLLAESGLVISGTHPDLGLVEFVELPPEVVAGSEVVTGVSVAVLTAHAPRSSGRPLPGTGRQRRGIPRRQR